jgi:scyllo-inositol 2-dehydrogenase (NADP+)
MDQIRISTRGPGGMIASLRAQGHRDARSNSGDSLRVAAFGAGWVTRSRHVPAMRADGGFEVVVVADRSAERAREAAAELGIPGHAGATALTQLAPEYEVDAVTCGTAPFAHYAVVRAALEAGKHVITEKPFTMTVPEGEELVALARDRGLVLAVVHNFQFARSVLKLKAWASSGRLGELRAIWAVQLSNPERRLPEWCEELPLGLFYDESPHLLYLARALAPQPLEPISAVVHPSTLGKQTPAHINLQLRSGAIPVNVEMSFEAPVSEWHLALLGDRGLGAVDIFRYIAVFAPNDGGHDARRVFRTSASLTMNHWRGYVGSGPRHLARRLDYGNREVFRRFREAINGSIEPDGIGALDALEVLRLQHFVVDSQAQTGTRR